jgi:Na+/melibiose symporter-like transporter
LTFATSSLIGSLSDEHGRRGEFYEDASASIFSLFTYFRLSSLAILIIGLSLSTLSPLCLLVMQLVPTMSPYWFYSAGAMTGLVNWMAVALSSLTDVLPQKFRAPGIGLLLSGFMLGFSFSPLLSMFLNHLQLTFVSVLVVNGGFWATVCFLPETLPPAIAEEARRRRREDVVHRNLIEHIGYIITRPVREMAILNRSSFFRLISLLAFFSGMVSSADQTLLVYYVEERIGFTDKDVSIMYLIMGITGLFAQAILLKPLNDLVGEKMVVATCFFVGAVDNVMYGIAKDKLTIFAAVGLSALTGMAFPTISAIKANNVVSYSGSVLGAG